MKLLITFLLLAVCPIFSAGLICWSCLNNHETPAGNLDNPENCVNGNNNLEEKECNFEPGKGPGPDQEYRCYEKRLTSKPKYYTLSRLSKGCKVAEKTAEMKCEPIGQAVPGLEKKDINDALRKANPSYIHDAKCECKEDGSTILFTFAFCLYFTFAFCYNHHGCNNKLSEGEPPPVLEPAKNSLSCLSCDGHGGGEKRTTCKKGEVPKPVQCNVQVVKDSEQKHVCFTSTFKLEIALIKDTPWIGCYHESKTFKSNCTIRPYIGKTCVCTENNCNKILDYVPERSVAPKIYESSTFVLVILCSTVIKFSSNYILN